MSTSTATTAAWPKWSPPAKASPIPVDVKLESKDEILLEDEEELKKTNPNLALWISIKRQLSAENGAAYFGSDLKDAHIPGGAEVGGTKIEKFKAKLVSCDAPKKAKKLIVGISSPDMSEITLALETPIAVCPDKGTDIEFVGSPSEFTADPFNLTFAVENKDVVRLPPRVAAKKGVAPAKKAARLRNIARPCRAAASTYRRASPPGPPFCS